MRFPRVVFSSWTQWADRKKLRNRDLPGVYLLARFETRPPHGVDPQSREIIYIGETCKKLVSRWRQFNRSAFQGRGGHSGGRTYRRKRFGSEQDLYVAAFPVSADGMGVELRPLFIRYVERKLILEFARRWGKAPKCNSK